MQESVQSKKQLGYEKLDRYSKLGTSWLRFYRGLLWLRAVALIFYFFSMMTAFIRQEFPYALALWYADLFFLLCRMILIIMLCWEMRYLTRKAYVLNVVFLWVDVILNTIAVIMVAVVALILFPGMAYIIGYAMGKRFFGLVIFWIYTVMNLMYFKNRKELFYWETMDEILAANVNDKIEIIVDETNSEELREKPWCQQGCMWVLILFIVSIIVAATIDSEGVSVLAGLIGFITFSIGLIMLPSYNWNKRVAKQACREQLKMNSDFAVKATHVRGLSLKKGTPVFLHITRGEFIVSGRRSTITIPFDHIENVYFEITTTKINRVGDAIIGLVFLGLIGAFIGGTQKDKRIQSFLAVDYRKGDSDEIETIVFKHIVRKTLDYFAKELKRKIL